MASASRVLRFFDLASPTEREDILLGLIDRISLDEVEFLAKARHKSDIFGHDRMPLEIRFMIVQYLEITDICNCALLVCRKWTNLFMKSDAMAQDVLQTWFPCLYHRTMPVRDMLELFAQVIMKRYLQNTGRFQTRYARDFKTQTDDSVNLPASLEECVTQGRSVIITTKQGGLLLWTFLCGMVQIDTNSMPRNPEAYYGAPEGQPVPIRPLTTREVRRSGNFFHPEDSKVFFLATDDEGKLGCLRVYEFRNMLCSRVFTYNVAHIFEMPPYEAWVRTTVAAEKVDAHGTYALLGFQGKLDGIPQIIHVVFNTLSTSFSTLSFAPCPEFGAPNTLWNDTAIYFKEEQDELRAMQEEILTDASKHQRRHDRTINGYAGQTPTPRDIVRYQDLSREYPHATDFHDEWGLLYTCSFFKGADRRQLHGTSFSFSYDRLFCDDDFLIVVSYYGVYTVFAVDADRKMSKAWLQGLVDSQDKMDTRAWEFIPEGAGRTDSTIASVES
ncbi:hypothetical protein SLS53_001341 [Cytospora paraplurivora]|uniref:F-box domain-containing protein n=1 Tax=Cytospora paraplurivora TaxID=2898453 RepID=A0AAN9UGY4_9PEZI